MAKKTYLCLLGIPGAFRQYLARVFAHVHCDCDVTMTELYTIAAIATEGNSVAVSLSEKYSITATATDDTGI